MDIKTETSNGVIRLRGFVQNYEWGRDGSDSLVGQFGKEAIGPDFELDEKTPYAELWMGTHPNGPATLFHDNDKTLSEHLHEHKELLGVAGKLPSPADEPTNAHLPFLFKVLTCKKALPLQIHPNKELAAQLHREDPEQFKDFNHKPEIAVALKPFQGFVGFRPADDIAATIEALDELDEILDKRLQQAFVARPKPATLKPLFAALLKVPTEKAKLTIKKIAAHVEEDGPKALGKGVPNAEKVAEVLVKLEKQYGGDPGVLAASIFMNLVELQPGEGIYAGADEAHAWLQGQIFECMATSDNVLNVGMTDDAEKNSVDLFVRTVSANPRPGDSFKLKSEYYNKSTGKHTTTYYHTPFEEFSMIHIAKEGAERLKALKGPMVAIITDGRGKAGAPGKEFSVEPGTVLFVAAGTEFSVSDGVEVWAAFKDDD